jgi:hypothetical protein
MLNLQKLEARFIHKLNCILPSRKKKSRDSSVGIASGYGLDDRMFGVQLPATVGSFTRHHVQTGSGAHPASCPMGTRGSFPWGKAAGG